MIQSAQCIANTHTTNWCNMVPTYLLSTICHLWYFHRNIAEMTSGRGNSFFDCFWSSPRIFLVLSNFHFTLRGKPWHLWIIFSCIDSHSLSKDKFSRASHFEVPEHSSEPPVRLAHNPYWVCNSFHDGTLSSSVGSLWDLFISSSSS